MNITDKQAQGIVALISVMTLVYVYLALSPTRLFLPANIPFIDSAGEQKPVSLTVAGREGGVYFLPQDSTVSDLFRAAGLDGQSAVNKTPPRILKEGDSVVIDNGQYSVGTVKAAQALALDLPLEINHLTADDLLLIPGIGQKTALAITALRETRGAFRAMEELMEIKGIKEKRLEMLKRYLFVEKRP